jgi:hypothetical protein
MTPRRGSLWFDFLILRHQRRPAALGGRRKQQRLHVAAARLERHAYRDLVSIDFHVAEELVPLHLAWRQLRLLQCPRAGIEREPELVPVHVVTGSNAIAHFDRLVYRKAGRQSKGLIRLEQFGFRACQARREQQAA